MTEAAAQQRRWDPVVRITHWTIALAVLANAIITEEGSAPHIWVGYGLAAILALRLLWGLVGPTEARFVAFWPSPRKAIAHVREIRSGTVTHHASHNPLGALMVFAIWSCLLMIIATGIAMAGAPPLTDTASGGEQRVAYEDEERNDHEAEHAGEEASGEGDEILEEIHEVAANLLYLLILLHIAGVMFETRRSGRQVLVAMSPLRR
ncbi:MAG: cytochrome b/b6 domain-containing protein [Erythrobacter sp.]|nr:cytochrome b/b6 domain-containing protein [Erythrobacter sp.]MDZ4139466.1 cytochrome b/b6 domain-containing protein [Erythrobacter sp.]MDZ4271322.1 cytochrome b/b6 domain-containing protein [Erythrobacter sp.]